MNKKELRHWMEIYRNNWIEARNKLIRIQNILNDVSEDDIVKMKEDKVKPFKDITTQLGKGENEEWWIR